MSEQSFVYVCSGTETADFHVALPIPFADDEYHVMASLAGATNSFGIEDQTGCPATERLLAFASRQTTAPHSGDRIEFAVFGKLFAEDASTTGASTPCWRRGCKTADGAAAWSCRQGGSHLDDTVRFDQVAGQELVGQGARATRLVWRGPSDRPAFDLNRCQDCGIGHLSLEVADSIVKTEKSVQDLSCSGTTVMTSAADLFTVGQVVSIRRQPQAYDGRHVELLCPTRTPSRPERKHAGTDQGRSSPRKPQCCRVASACTSATASATRRNASGARSACVATEHGESSVRRRHRRSTNDHSRSARTTQVAIDYWVIKVSDELSRLRQASRTLMPAQR